MKQQEDLDNYKETRRELRKLINTEKTRYWTENNIIDKKLTHTLGEEDAQKYGIL